MLLFIFNSIYFKINFYFYGSFHFEVYKKGFKNYFFICLFIFFSIFRYNINLKKTILKLLTFLVTETFLSFLAALRFFIFSFFEYYPYFYVIILL